MEIKKNFPEELIKNPKSLGGRILWYLGLAIILWMVVFGYIYTWKGQYLHIHMERGVCLGQCAVYQVDIYGSGLVLYNGKLWVEEEGFRFQFISQRDVQKIIAQMDESGYFSLDDSYLWAATDLPSTITQVTYSNLSKTILHYPDEREPNYDVAPSELGRFERVIENVVIEWVGDRK